MTVIQSKWREELNDTGRSNLQGAQSTWGATLLLESEGAVWRERRDGRCGRRRVDSSGIGTADIRCVCGNASSVRQIERTSTHSPARCTRAGVLRCVFVRECADVTTWCSVWCSRRTDRRAATSASHRYSPVFVAERVVVVIWWLA